MQRKIVVFLSDTHAGSNVALMPPGLTLHDEGPNGELIPYSPEQTASQVYLWDLYQGYIQRVMEIAGRDDVIVLHVGDVCQGNKYPVGLVTTRLADQVLIAASNLSEWLKHSQVKSVRLLASTGSHAFGEASADILVTEMLKQKYPLVDIDMAYHSLLTIAGVTFDCAHHGPYVGSREWLRGNVAQLYLRDLMISSIVHGLVPPSVVVRAHYHSFVEVVTEVGQHRSTLIVLPSFSMLGDYAHQAAKSPYWVTNGMVAMDICDGEIVREHRLMKGIDTRTRGEL
ncbi:MAG TPA: hypothetical protein PLT26_14905 [Anaerolineaceae bacterium]|nr:hypothetical protein [Anaerolineaceae bacterium]